MKNYEKYLRVQEREGEKVRRVNLFGLGIEGDARSVIVRECLGGARLWIGRNVEGLRVIE